ncbi:MAG TPA: ROK family protein [Thermomicrobiales bacterium]|nr:ROK family protein [Thermomicrobiales bacterium]
MARLAIGVDFGGTKVLASVVDVDSGKIRGTGKKKTDPNDGPDELMSRIYEVARKAVSKSGAEMSDMVGVCVGIAGQVDTERGILVGTANLSRSVVDLQMARLLEEELGIPAIIRNDVQIAAAGENRFGAGKDVDDFVVIFVGTGIGGGIVRDGQIIKGSAGNAGELGHTTVDANGRICGCGGRGHLEAYASRTGMTRALWGEIRRGRSSVLSKLLPHVDPADPATAPIKSSVIRKALEEDDAVVREIVEEGGRYLGLGLANVVNFLNPTRIILGGGVVESLDLFFDVAEQETRKQSLAHAGEAVQIVRAGLGDFSGVVGAAVLAADAAAGS